MSEFKKTILLFGCFIFGHKWIHKKTIRKDIIHPKKNIWFENYENIWYCNYCNTVVKTHIKKKPNNSKRIKFELINDFFNYLIK